MEFFTPTKLSESEQRFADNVLIRGEDEGIWKVDRFIAGGSLEQRSVIGTDFLVYNPNGGALWIEYKEIGEFNFTEAQLLRFLKSKDHPWVATRFCGVKTSYSDPKEATMVCYWTPNFIRGLQNCFYKKLIEEGERKYTIHQFRFMGLADYIKQNSFISLYKKYSGKILDELIKQWCNLNIYKIVKGELGFTGSWFETFNKELAYEILYKKLKWTISNLTEDVGKIYVPCERKLPQWWKQKDYLEQEIQNRIKCSYRPLYAGEIAESFEGDPVLCPRKEGKILYLGEEELEKIVRLALLRGVKAGIYKHFSITGYLRHSYGLKGVSYMPLTLKSSIFLDALGLTVSSPGEETTLREMADSTGWTFERIKYQWVRHAGDELAQYQLIKFRKEPKIFIKLLEKGYNYLHRLREP